MKKKFLLFTLLLFFFVQSFAVVTLNLVGEWKAETISGHVEDGDRFTSGKIASYVITEQNDYAFKGYKLIDTVYEKGMKENFSGVISYDGKKLYFAEHHDGYAFADVVTDDLLYFYYLEAKEAND
jgi:hypothetical protein